MALAGYKPSTTPRTTAKTVEISSDHYKGVVYDDRHEPLHHLLSYVSGSPWTLDGYYRQKLGRDNDLRQLDIRESEEYQQYELIRHLEIRVSSTLSSSYNNELATTSVTGSALVYPFTVPNVNDYFKASTIDNQRALFRVTQVERRTVNRDSYFQIDYELVGYSNYDKELFINLDNKVVATYYFNKDRLLENLNPLLTSSQQHVQRSNRVSYSDLVQFYFRTFVHKGYSTLVIPGLREPGYDHFLTKFLLSIVETDEVSERRFLRTLVGNYHPYFDGYQFWDAIYNMDFGQIEYGNKKMNLVSTKYFTRDTYLAGLHFGLIKYVVFPDAPYSDNLSGPIPKVPMASIVAATELEDPIEPDIEDTEGESDENEDNDGSNDSGDNDNDGDDNTGDQDDENENDSVPLTPLEPSIPNPLIKKVSVDNYYVLSENFYTRQGPTSVLEQLTHDYLDAKMLDQDKLHRLASSVHSWGRLEQFYYIPLLLVLLKHSARQRY